MNKRITFFSKLFTISVFALTLFSCSFLENINEETTNQQTTGTAYITLGKTSLARNISPSAYDLNKNNLQNVSLSGTWESESESRILVAEKETWSEFYGFFSPDGFEIQTGSWMFTLSAEMNGIAFTGIIDDNNDGVNDSVTITEGTTKTLTFVLKATTETCGGLDITMNIDNAVNDYAQTVIISLTDSSNNEIDTKTLSISGDSVNYTRQLSDADEKLTAGEYYIQFSFKYAYDSLPILNVFKEKVIIVAGITTTATRNISIDTVYTLSYVTNDSDIDIDDYDHVTKYTRKSSTITLPVLSRTGYSFGGWYDNETLTGSSITTITTPLAGNTLYAKWIPNDDTPYTVRHWMQKAGGSNTHDSENYELIDDTCTENKTGTTASTVSITVKDTTSGDYFGFEPPTSAELSAADATTIAADGSTFVDLYYNRRIYAISYTDGLDDTIDVPNASEAQFGASYTIDFTSVGIRENYAFGGWTDGTNTYIEGDTETLTMPADDVILTAIWNPLFAIVNGTNYYTLADAQLAIRNATEDTTVILTSAVTRADIRIDDFNPNSITDSNTISDAIRNTTAKISLSVKEGDTLSLSGDCCYLFLRCSKLVSIDLSGFNVDNATSIYGMFSQCSGLTTLDLSSFNTSNVTSMMALFQYCSNLESITFGSNFNTSNASSMHAMFSDCSKLKSIDVSGFDTSKADSFTNMFTNCSTLTMLDISSWSVARNPNIPCMFYGCTNLKTILVSESFASYTSSLNASSNDNVFTGCTSLVGGNGTTYDSDNTDSTYARIDVSGTPGYFSKPFGTKAKPTEIGDIVFKDGTATPYSDSLNLSTDEKNAAIAVIFYVGTNCSNKNGDEPLEERILGLGFKQISSNVGWQKSTSPAEFFPSIKCVPSDGSYPVNTCDRDGRDNYTQIASDLGNSDNTSDESNYPGFQYARNYGANLTNLTEGSSFASEWYLPTCAEFAEIAYQTDGNDRMQLLQDIIDFCYSGSNKVTLVTSMTGTFLTSSSSDSTNASQCLYAYKTRTGSVGPYVLSSRTAQAGVLAIRQFN